MPKRWPFFLVFFMTLGLVVASGLLGKTTFLKENASKMQPFPQVTTSISTSEEQTASRQTVNDQKEAAPSTVWYRNRVVVLTYHHVTDDSDQRYVIGTKQFEKHMQFLYENNLHPISLAEFVRFVETGLLPTENAVLITFDDGYESYYTHAFPVLTRYGFPSVNFAILGRLKDTEERKREKMTTPLTRPQVKEMLRTGLVDIGSHTYSLHDEKAKNEWGDLGPETAPVYLQDMNRLEEEQEYRTRLYIDFTMSRVGLSELIGKQVEAISLPFGYSNSIVLDTAKQAGYRFVFNSNPGVVAPDVNPLSIPRNDVGLREIDAGRLQELFQKVKNAVEGEQ
ncbi:polysaccharide deacetylase family protein [Brevibacillus ruminantium]|uniref:Polysaccharide deacetylase family protein n=1 Tax=Brevibacillus ruminantium TaxID=2950604 RepID=A0ABY4WF21_9BACL|nr:polysaccharide deacetylase family protein [Brevibacillus ruminantium]USG65339.1 polysaccharide deacetylase family protein [Brevibacillus ruminantium]